MEIFSAGLLFFVLLVISIAVSFAQQDPSYHKLVAEVETLKKEVSVLQNELQTVENVEKMKLLAERDDAKVRLINVEFGKLERELRDFNHKWLMTWLVILLGILGIFLAFSGLVGRGAWSHLKSKINQEIANEVEKSLNGFKEAVDEVKILKDKIRILDTEHAARVVGNTMPYPLRVADSHSEEIRDLSEEALLDVLRDGTSDKGIKIRALEILTYKVSTQLVSPTLELLNSILDLHQDKELGFYTINYLRELIILLGYTPTEETYKGLIKFLDRLVLREYTKPTDLLLATTGYSFAKVGQELNKEDWISLLKTSFSRLYNEPETMKGILHHLPDEIPNVDDFKDHLLELLEPHDAEFVKTQRE